MKKLVGLFIATLGVIAIASCDKEPDPSLVIGVDADVVVESPSASYTFTFTTNQAWTAESDSDWLTLETTSGQAGEIALVAAYTANNTNDYRYAKVSISAGSLKEEYTLAQKPVVKASEDKRISKAAQDISIPVNKEADAVVVALESDWLTKNDAASTNTALVLSATANESSFAREVVVTVTNNGTITTYTIRQNGNAVDLTLNKIVYLGRKNLVYDSAGYHFFDEFAFVCVSEDNKEVVLTVNAKKIEGEVKSVPDSTYVLDQGNTHEPGTFSIDPIADYYTHVEGVESIIDGEIVVESAEGVYSVVATLSESEEKTNTYSFTGSVESIVDESLGIQIYSLNYEGQYATWYTTAQAKKWALQIVMSANYDPSVPYLTWVTLELFAASSQEPSELPTGTFTVIDKNKVPTIESKYLNGITDYQPGTIAMSGNDDEFNGFVVTDGGSVTITKQDNGRYTIAFDTEVKVYYRDENNWSNILDSAVFNYKPIIEDITMPAVNLDNESKPMPDGDTVLGGGEIQTITYWYGQKMGDDYDAFAIAFNSVGATFGGYQVGLALTVANDKYEFVADAGKTSSTTTYVPAGTYTFSANPADFALVPAASSRAGFITNPYTGTKYFITGGSVTIEYKSGSSNTGTITYNVKATPGTAAKDAETGVYNFTPAGTEATFTGSHGFKWARMNNTSTGALPLLVIPAE